MRQQRQNSLPMRETGSCSPSHSETKQELNFKKVFSAAAKTGNPSLYVSTLKSQALSLTPRASSRDNREKILVLDLDHTLMCNFKQGESPVKGLYCPLKIRGCMYTFTIVKRPGLEKFLYEVTKIYRLMLYTTSLEEYAIGVLRVLGILPLFEKILHRENCIQQPDGTWLKNLKEIGEPLEKIVFVDDSMKQVEANAPNAVPIVPFQTDLTDNNLLKLIPFLRYLTEKSDVRHVFQQYQKLYRREKKEKKERQSNKLVINIKTSKDTRCSLDTERYGISVTASPINQLNQSIDYEVPDNETIMPSIRMFEPKLLGSPTIEEKMNSFTDFYNKRLLERDTDLDDDPENAVFDDEDEEDGLRDTTPRLMGNFSKKSPMHHKKKI